MKRRSFLKAMTAAFAAVSMPLASAKENVVDYLVDKGLVTPTKGFYMRFPSGLEFVLMEQDKRRIPMQMQFMATHIYDFKHAGGCWLKNRWPTGAYPQTHETFRKVRKMTREELVDEGILYRVGDEEEHRTLPNMTIRVNMEKLHGKDRHFAHASLEHLGYDPDQVLHNIRKAEKYL